ncbi:hypothetical protein QJQ45_012400, partial [Haematococcus lacustris]
VPVDVSLIPNIKKKKGKKKEAVVVPALERIMGYAGSDISEDEASRHHQHMMATAVCSIRLHLRHVHVYVVSEEDPDDEESKEDGVVDREYIKMRAAKLSQRASRAQLHAYGRGSQAEHREAIALIFSSSGARRTYDNLSFIGDNFARITNSTAHPHLVDAVFGLLAQLSSDNPSTQTAAANALEHAYVGYPPAHGLQLPPSDRSLQVGNHPAHGLQLPPSGRALQVGSPPAHGLQLPPSGRALQVGIPPAHGLQLPTSGSALQLGSPPAHGLQLPPSPSRAHQQGSPLAHGLQQPPSPSSANQQGSPPAHGLQLPPSPDRSLQLGSPPAHGLQLPTSDRALQVGYPPAHGLQLPTSDRALQVGYPPAHGLQLPPSGRALQATAKGVHRGVAGKGAVSKGDTTTSDLKHMSLDDTENFVLRLLSSGKRDDIMGVYYALSLQLTLQQRQLPFFAQLHKAVAELRTHNLN